MGNHMCLGANAVHQVQDDQWALPPVKVVTPDGGIQAFKRSVTVAELIKLHPDHFVCHSKALKTALTQKAVLPKDLQLEAGRLYYVLPISKLQEQEQKLQVEPKPADDLIGHHDKVIASRAPGAPGAHGAVKLDPLQPFEINLVQSKRQQQQHQQQPQHQMPGFAQVTLLRAASDYEKETPIISYSTPDLRSMYLMNGPPSSSSKKTTPMLTRSNSWKPRLETISEVRAFSRRRIQNLVNRAVWTGGILKGDRRDLQDPKSCAFSSYIPNSVVQKYQILGFSGIKFKNDLLGAQVRGTVESENFSSSSKTYYADLQNNQRFVVRPRISTEEDI